MAKININEYDSVVSQSFLKTSAVKEKQER
jgi:hypothetical protein